MPNGENRGVAMIASHPNPARTSRNGSVAQRCAFTVAVAAARHNGLHSDGGHMLYTQAGIPLGPGVDPFQPVIQQPIRIDSGGSDVTGGVVSGAHRCEEEQQGVNGPSA